MKKIFYTSLAVIATISFVVSLTWNGQSKKNELVIANIEALTQIEQPSLGYFIDDWEDEYPDRYVNGSWIWIVEGGRNCYEEAGDEPDCLESYYRKEERR